MHISKIYIQNFKRFQTLTLPLNKGLNILVGDNESGKSTILEAIHLVLSGLLHGKYLKSDATEYLFNRRAVEAYLRGMLPGNSTIPPPKIMIELYFEGEGLSLFTGDGNIDRNVTAQGVRFTLEFAEKYQSEYETLVKKGRVRAIPTEYYEISLSTFARHDCTTRGIPLKSAFIDSSHNRYQSGADIHLSHILRNFLSDEQKLTISQSHREMKDSFMESDGIRDINEELRNKTKQSETDKAVTLAVDLSSKNMWENSLLTYLDDVPFHHIGKGEQSIVKTKLALEHKKAMEASIVLLEEPENHLSHSRLNQLIQGIKAKCSEKQIIVSTHSSFVANKLGLDSLILLHAGEHTRLSSLTEPTQNFFKRISGYGTLRLLLCKRAILVEGDSDELIVQKAYMERNGGKLPIEDGIDVISVGTSFLRFLEIAEKIQKAVTVVTDNDGDVEALRSKYAKYLGRDPARTAAIRICFDEEINQLESDEGTSGGKPFNLNTLEPNLLKVNSLTLFNEIFDTTFDSRVEMLIHMRANKTECALKIFETAKAITLPDYIQRAIS